MKSATMKCTAIALACCAVAAADGAEQVSIDLTGVEIRNGASVYRSSAPDTIDPAFAYRHEIDGMVQGSGLGLGSLFPSPTPLAEALETLAPGSSAFLTGQFCNPSGEHPLELFDQRFEGETIAAGITVQFAATFEGGLDETGVAWFSITEIILSPSLLVGSLRFVSGEVVIERVACRADINDDGGLDFFDFLEFQSLFAAGDPRADFNCDGAMDFFDFLSFQSAFAAGCP